MAGARRRARRLRHVGIQEDGGRHEEREAVPLQPALRVALAEDRAQRARRLVEGVLEGGQVQGGLAPVVGRRLRASASTKMRSSAGAARARPWKQ